MRGRMHLPQVQHHVRIFHNVQERHWLLIRDVHFMPVIVCTIYVKADTTAYRWHPVRFSLDEAGAMLAGVMADNALTHAHGLDGTHARHTR